MKILKVSYNQHRKYDDLPGEPSRLAGSHQEGILQVANLPHYERNTEIIQKTSLMTKENHLSLMNPYFAE